MLVSGQLYSKVLEMDTGITVLSPSNYRIRDKMKVCYLFHGLGGNNQSWINNTMLKVFSEKYNILFIMPEVQRSYYINKKYGSDYFTYIVDELPIIIGSLFNISKARDDNIVIGSSMGGYGALKAALTRPEVYGYCYSFSPIFLYLDIFLKAFKKSRDNVNFRTIYGQKGMDDILSLFGEELIAGEEDILLKLAEKNMWRTKTRLNILFGDRDSKLEEGRSFRDDINALGYNIKYSEIEGEHDWIYFNKALELALKDYINKR